MTQQNNRVNADVKIQDENDEDHNLWLEILSQVQESSPNKLPSCKAVLVLGDNESGKTSLISKLQGNEDTKKGSGLEYHFINVRDEYRDDSTRLGVWVLDGDPWHRNLLKYVLNEETFADTTILLTAAFTQPWYILESLQNWATIVEEHVQRLRLPEDVLEQHRSKVLKRYQDYLEPGAEIDGITSPIRPANASIADSLTKDIKMNLGLEIVVIITKTDYMSTLEKDFDFKEEHFDFIQQKIRNFCLSYGASLFFVSVKENKNIDLLSKYLVHKIFCFPFRTAALVVEKDAVFIPAGWDNDSKIHIIVDNLTSVKPDDPYHEVISKPISRKPMQREAEVVAEDDQSFLLKLQSLLSQQVPATGGRVGNTQDNPMRTPPPGVQKTAERRISGSPGVQASPKKIEGKAGTVGGEGVLQNFFNSLLNRRTGSPIGGPLPSVRSPSDKTTSRHDAVAELDRMQKTKKSSSLNQASESTFSDGGSDNPTT